VIRVADAEWVRRLVKPAGEPSRVLFAYRSDVDAQGGAAGVMHRTADGLRSLGVEVDVTFDVKPPLGAKYDLVHAFNVWSPESALAQMQYLRSKGVPIVWQPIYLKLSEFVFASLASRAIFAAERSEADRANLLRALQDGSLHVNGATRFMPMEPDTAFFSRVSTMARAADHLCLCSTTEAQALFQAAGLVSKPFSVIPHGVDLELFGSASPEAFQKQFGVFDFVLSVGAVEPRKNQLFLIEALRGTGRKIVLIGPSFDLDYLSMCRARGGDDLIYIDRLPQDLVASAYKAARVHALPSYAEGAAMANLEASATGCPIVVSDRSSEFEYFSDLAYYCSPIDLDSIRSAVLQAWEGRTAEPERWQSLVARMQAYTWHAAAEATLRAYRRVLARVAR
jgi:glycosyltransferase involved in cell wall biosynthesis